MKDHGKNISLFKNTQARYLKLTAPSRADDTGEFVKGKIKDCRSHSKPGHN
jgi:hypothetical protein